MHNLKKRPEVFVLIVSLIGFLYGMSLIVSSYYYGVELVRLDNSKFEECGSLHIPDLGINEKIYLSLRDESQKIVDAPNAIARVEWSGKAVYTDHRSQSFYHLPKAKPEETVATIYGEDGVRMYVCYHVANGTIIEKGDISTIYSDEYLAHFLNTDDSNICLYTCKSVYVGDRGTIILTYWRPVDFLSNHLIGPRTAELTPGQPGVFL